MLQCISFYIYSVINKDVKVKPDDKYFQVVIICSDHAMCTHALNKEWTLDMLITLEYPFPTKYKTKTFFNIFMCSDHIWISLCVHYFFQHNIRDPVGSVHNILPIMCPATQLETEHCVRGSSISLYTKCLYLSLVKDALWACRSPIFREDIWCRVKTENTLV